MKTLLFSALVLLASGATASAINVSTPANGAQVMSPFRLVADTATCGSVPAAAMGYSIDHGRAVIEPTSFSAMVTASTGPHILHVKCWGKKTHDEVLLSITVGQSAPSPEISVMRPADGARLTSPFSVDASATACGSAPAVAMGYSIDHGAAVIEPSSFSATVSASAGPHILHVKCWGRGTHSEILRNITVVPSGSGSDITVTSPANASQITSPFTLAAHVSSCASSSATALGYSVDGARMVVEPVSFAATVTANPGAHVLRVSCSGANGSDQAVLNIDVAAPSPAAVPVFAPAPGTYSTKQTVTLFDATPGAVIHYTTDGSVPTAQSPQYVGPISVAGTTAIQAIATAPSFSQSRVASGYYSIAVPSGPVIPPTAAKETGIQLMPNWRIKHDPATGGAASGAMSIVGDPSISGQAASFVTSFTRAGGVLYSVTWGHDPLPHNFVYDAEVWIDGGSNIGNLEMDNNQVIGNGDTIIYAFQCAGDDGVWDYSENAGTPQHPQVKWVRSNQPCDPAKWTPNTWHHVQISYSRDDAGNVTYHSVWLDGVEQPINKTVNSDFALHWAAGDLVANFQVDGIGASGGSTLYLDNFTIYRW